MIKVDVISGFLGAGKTTLIKKLFEGSLKKKKQPLLKMSLAKSALTAVFYKTLAQKLKKSIRVAFVVRLLVTLKVR